MGPSAIEVCDELKPPESINREIRPSRVPVAFTVCVDFEYTAFFLASHFFRLDRVGGEGFGTLTFTPIASAPMEFLD